MDIPSKDVLLDALQRYTGTILFVSHDHDFVNNLATHIIVLTPDGATLYHGTYDEYLYQKAMTGAGDNAADISQKVPPSRSCEAERSKKVPQSRVSDSDHRKKIMQIEKTISSHESSITKIEGSFADLDYGTPAFTEALEKLQMLKNQLAAATKTWEQLHE